ncbi:aminotransferase class I/II-fold pyridoxal phosphate-dependent enzyme [Microbacterium foliorum]|uniref:cysteine-S-conjugate beta-lyase n=1 Tax=Microbacterium foliorum TaxID=104336 RepID=A0A0F0LCB5_9MICO|nr:aminotransferase class I/II-fold pyridoxal phosphate-dependent enzyme [Microbacterium foliorum]AXL10868.1 aminotransferase class I/II-fold pyridoxal phosphate-dependent enzyme [Microbacterium foliorum]KJL29925.1 Cystathionine beta-lyase PatB [Microbacterium foliorum]
MTSPAFDRITRDDLRSAGSLKWTTFPDMIGAFVAEMDFGLAPAITTAVKDALDLGVTGYLPATLAQDLSAATARWYADSYGWEIPADRVHHVPDVIAAFELAIENFTSPGSAVIVPTPAYMPFLFVPPMHDRRVIEVPSIEVDGRWVMDLDAVAQAFRDGGEMLVLCNPHNPLGTVATRDELLAIAETVSAAGGRVFADEIHAPIVYAPAQHIPYASVSDAAAAHTFTATSASKAWNLAGLKCAQVIISNDADAELWERLGFWPGHGTSTLGVVANIAAYTAGAPWLDEVVDYLDGNRRMLAQLVDEKLPGVRMIVPEGSYIALLDFRETGLTGDLAEWFREHAGVAMTDGAACGEAAIGYTRFVFALPRPLLVEAVERIAAALAGRASVSA